MAGRSKDEHSETEWFWHSETLSKDQRCKGMFHPLPVPYQERQKLSAINVHVSALSKL